jgi:hypothetical protein
MVNINQEASMKLIFTLMVLLGAVSTAHAGIVSTGTLVGEGTYLDDFPGTPVAPDLELVMGQGFSGLKDWALVESVGVGALPTNAIGQSGNWLRVGGDIAYGGLAKDLKLSVGGAVESNQALFRQYGDYVHASLSYKLW